MEWIRLVFQVKAPDDLPELFLWISFPDEIAMRNLTVLKERQVTREYGPLLLNGKIYYFSIFKVIPVNTVETEQPEISGKGSEVHIEDEFWLPERLRTQQVDAGYVDCFKYRVDRNKVIRHWVVIKVDRFLVYKDQIDFRMRNAK